MNLVWRIFARFNRLRAARARAAARRFDWRAEKFFCRINGAQR